MRKLSAKANQCCSTSSFAQWLRLANCKVSFNAQYGAPGSKSCQIFFAPESKLICPARAPYRRNGSGVSKRKSYKARSISAEVFGWLTAISISASIARIGSTPRGYAVCSQCSKRANGANTSHAARRLSSCAVTRCSIRSFSSSSVTSNAISAGSLRTGAGADIDTDIGVEAGTTTGSDEAEITGTTDAATDATDAVTIGAAKASFASSSARSDSTPTVCSVSIRTSFCVAMVASSDAGDTSVDISAELSSDANASVVT